MIYDSKQLLETFFDYALSCLALLTPDFNFIRVNNAYAQAGQRDVSEFPGHNHFDFYPSAENRAIFEEVVRSKQPYSVFARPFEYAGSPERGVTYWDWALVPVLDENGNVKCLLLSLNDVTVRIKAQEALQRSEERAQAMLNAIPDMMFRMDSHGVYLDYQAENGELYHQPDTGIIGKRCRDILPPELAEVIEHNILQVMAANKTITFEYRLDVPHRGIRDYEARMVPCGTAEVVAIVRDITERKQADEKLRKSEEKYRELVEHANSIIIHWTSDGRITFMNEYGQQFFGFTEAEIIGRQVVGTIVPETESTGRDLRPIMDQVCADPKAFENNINENIKKNGERVWVAWTNKVAFDDQNRIVGILSIGTDVTERRRNEAERDEALALVQTVINAAPVRIFWKDRDGSYLGCNPLFARDAGKNTPDELLGKDDYDMGWAEQAELYRTDDRLVMEGGTAKLNFVEPQTTPDGRTIHLRTSKVPLRNMRGDVIGVLGIYDDITEQKLAMEKVDTQFNELRRWHEVMLNREERIIKLKQEVNELLARLREPLRYDSVKGEEA